VHRITSQAKAVLQIDGVSIPAHVTDVSQGGMLVRVQGSTALRVHSQAQLAITTAGAETSGILPVKVANLRFEDNLQWVGLSFSELSPAQYRVVSGLMYGDLRPLRNARMARQKPRSILAGTMQILAWCFGHTLRGVSFALFRRKRGKAQQTFAAGA
jgi:cellulose synthase (UDP-forming)